MTRGTLPPPATAYHGTNALAAERIQSEGFKQSRNKFDWLGAGIYFFQDSERRAMDWARKVHSSDPVVIRAEIDLDGCMDLLDPTWFSILPEAHEEVIRQHRAARCGCPSKRA